MFWLPAAALAVLGIIPIYVAVRRVSTEAIALRREIVRFSDLRPALVELRTDAQVLRTSAITKLDRR
jgi:hypothetical protein